MTSSLCREQSYGRGQADPLQAEVHTAQAEKAAMTGLYYRKPLQRQSFMLGCCTDLKEIHKALQDSGKKNPCLLYLYNICVSQRSASMIANSWTLQDATVFVYLCPRQESLYSLCRLGWYKMATQQKIKQECKKCQDS